jgi:hypothetical protein
VRVFAGASGKTAPNKLTTRAAGPMLAAFTSDPPGPASAGLFFGWVVVPSPAVSSLYGRLFSAPPGLRQVPPQTSRALALPRR